MNYLERLIRRALAVPRDTDQGLFDPFEQTAPWALDEAQLLRARAPTPGTVPAAAERDPPSAGAAPSAIGREPPILNPVDATPPPVVQSAVRVMKVEQALMPTLPVTPSTPDAEPLHEKSLARADAFMQSLKSAQDPPDARHRSVEPPRSAGEHDARHVAVPPRRAAPVPPDAGDPPSIRPVAPRPPAVFPPARVQSPDREKAQPRAEPANRDRRAPPAGQPSVITRTVVIAPPRSRQLDDLAHGSAISRFGLGQS